MKYRIATFILMLTVLMTSCDYTKPPFGVWHSDDPEMMLAITPDSKPEWWGEITLDGEYHEIYVLVGHGNSLTLTDRSNVTETVIHGDDDLMTGSCYLEGRYHEKLRFVLTSRYAEATGYKNIYFTKVTDTYEEYLAKKEAGELD